MSAVDIWRELIAAQADVSADPILLGYGVPADITPFCGVALIRRHGPFYEPDTGGTPAVIIPAMDGGDLADLVAFTPRQLGRWQVRLGGCPLLGIDNLGIWSAPLHLWRTPLAYLRAGLQGVVVLSWPAAIPRLTCCSELIAEDIDHGREIRRRLTRSNALPKISVPSQRRVA